MPPPAGGGWWLQVVAASYLTCMPGLRTARELALRDSSGWTPHWERHWLYSPRGATHPSISGRPGKISRASCVLWKATSLVPQLSLLCRSVRLTSSFTPWKSKYRIRFSVFQCKFFIWLLANKYHNTLKYAGPQGVSLGTARVKGFPVTLWLALKVLVFPKEWM